MPLRFGGEASAYFFPTSLSEIEACASIANAWSFNTIFIQRCAGIIHYSPHDARCSYSQRPGNRDNSFPVAPANKVIRVKKNAVDHMPV